MTEYHDGSMREIAMVLALILAIAVAAQNGLIDKDLVVFMIAAVLCLNSH